MKEIKKISQNNLIRSARILKLAVSSSKSLFKNKKRDLKSQISGVLESQSEKIVTQLGLMKGPIMKMGQVLSMYSQDIIPVELQKAFSKLENSSFYLGWNKIKKNIPSDILNKLEIEEKPFAAASLGQVHKGIIKESGEKIAIKIQYTNVDQAIDNDLKNLKRLLWLAKLIPKDLDLDPLFEEIKTMLSQEMDYEKELQYLNSFEKLARQDSEYIFPKTFGEYSGKDLLTMSYLEGTSLRDLSHLSQEQRNSLGRSMLNLVFAEIFKWGQMQTDAHPGNFLVSLEEKPRLMLLDFGASKVLSPKQRKIYQNFMRAVCLHDFELFENTLHHGEFIDSSKSYDRNLLIQYFEVISRPFQEGSYDWGESTIPDKVLAIFPKLYKEFSHHRAPSDSIFIDRKIGGIFYLLKLMGANFSTKEVTSRYL